ncbi:MAG: tol-pal system-associated acyl-CoA thioesterase [Burkholderiales bacterium]|nr:tol-pal system-associated acyl-CoA thioesterase [Burkholderiales bacterium]
MPAIHSLPVEPATDDRADFLWTVRVYYEDTDAAGIVYYANYLKYFERCRTEWLRSLGFDQRQMAVAERLQFVVAGLSVQYLRPARLDDSLTIEATIVERARTYVVFSQRARRGAELLAAARVKVACVDTARLAPARLPAALVEHLRPQPVTSPA